MKNWWRLKVLPSLVFALARAVGLTMRVEIIGWDRVVGTEGGKLLAGWHGRTFLAANAFKGRGLWTIISHSRDGAVQDQIFRKFGYETIRGSTGRGGVRALAESIRALRDKGVTMAFTPDGPRGPTGVVQPGIVAMAKKAGVPMFPGGASASRRWLLGTWDSYMIPKPFSRGVIVLGDPIFVSKDASEQEIEEARLRLEAEIHAVQARADEMMGHAPETKKTPAAEDRG